MKGRTYLLVIFCIATGLSVYSCRKAASWLVVDDLPTSADALIVLMGSYSDRILQTVDLYMLGLSDNIVIVEPGMGASKTLIERGVPVVSEATRFCEALVTLGIHEDHISILPGEAYSTQKEAIIIRDYLNNATEMDTLILVTSPFHTRRASMIFEAAFKETGTLVHIFTSPNPYSNHIADKWWRNREMVQKVIFEYLKLANFILFEKRKIKLE